MVLAGDAQVLFMRTRLGLGTGSIFFQAAKVVTRRSYFGGNKLTLSHSMVAL